jgi:hypothetical protein
MADPYTKFPMAASHQQLATKHVPGINLINPAPASGHQSSDNPTFRQDSQDVEEHSEKDKSVRSTDVDGEAENIVYHYLTFETELPHPTSIYPSSASQEPPPPPPELGIYTSPFDWTPQKKSILIWISCVATALTAFTAGSYTPGVGQMTKEWNIGNVAALVGITTFTCGM